MDSFAPGGRFVIVIAGPPKTDISAALPQNNGAIIIAFAVNNSYAIIDTQKQTVTTNT